MRGITLAFPLALLTIAAEPAVLREAVRGVLAAEADPPAGDAKPGARSTAGPSAALTCPRTCVDLDADCDATTSDALASLRSVVGLFVPYVSAFPKLLDANRDGSVTIRDSQQLLRRVVGADNEIPCEVPVNPTSTTTTST